MQMTNTKILVSSALSAIATLAATTAIVQSAPAENPDYSFEKGYGFVKAGLNDCQTSSRSCAGASPADSQGDPWIYMPAGTCSQLTGGSTAPKA
jgi:uncharacterized membrane protein